MATICSVSVLAEKLPCLNARYVSLVDIAQTNAKKKMVSSTPKSVPVATDHRSKETGASACQESRRPTRSCECESAITNVRRLLLINLQMTRWIASAL